jgi:cleavage and polyadenylation specificity factor subunit 1
MSGLPRGVQEDPYKLVLLGKDMEHHCVTRADFFFDWEGTLSLIAGDEEGIIRVYEYNPQGESFRHVVDWCANLKHISADPDSRDGRYLLLRSEFHGQVEYRTAVPIARRDKEDPSIPQSKLLIGMS